MDLICTHCGEPWDVDAVLHEMRDEFERKGALITRCPSCPPGKFRPCEKTAARLATIKALAEMLGDDVDGFAATLEDFGLLKD